MKGSHLFEHFYDALPEDAVVTWMHQVVQDPHAELVVDDIADVVGYFLKPDDWRDAKKDSRILISEPLLCACG